MSANKKGKRGKWKENDNKMTIRNNPLNYRLIIKKLSLSWGKKIKGRGKTKISFSLNFHTNLSFKLQAYR